MSLLLRTETKIETTLVSNRFIDYYMNDANDAQIKVYLYLLRMLNSGQEPSISDLADKFNFTEREIMKALEYWSENGLIGLTYDDSNVLREVLFKNLNKSNVAEDSTVDEKEMADVSAIVPELGSRTLPPKKTYSKEDLKVFSKQPDIIQLIVLAESYKGKTLSYQEFITLLYIHEELKFSYDLCDFLLWYCYSRVDSGAEYIEKVATNWYQQNVETPKQAEICSLAYQKGTTEIMRNLGKNSNPTPIEAQFIYSWTKEMQFPMEIILEACSRSVLATDHNRFEYANGILNSWKQAEVKTLQDIADRDQANKRTSTKKNQQSGSSSADENVNRQNPQNHYDYDALEKELQDL